MDEIRFPATCEAHWSSGPVASCDKHAQEIVGLGRFMGLHVPLTTLTEPKECANCLNEAKEQSRGR
jgi:hypothetical protein